MNVMLSRSLQPLRRAWLMAYWWLEPDPVRKRVLRWLLDDPHEERRYAYPLHSNSVVFDVGGYRGDWADRIVRRYDPYVHIFEPVQSFADALEHRFMGQHKVRVHRFGLSDNASEELLMQAADASSTYTSSGKPTTVVIRDVVDVVDELGVDTISLVKMNIEGGEYPLLRRLIASGLVQRCADIQIQFHDFVPNGPRQRDEIRVALAHTHSLSYDYPFVWESWRRTTAPSKAP